MDAQERKDDMQEAIRHLEQAKALLDSVGLKDLALDVQSVMDDLDESIQEADEDALQESRMETGALTRAYFQDAIGAYGRLAMNRGIRS